MRPFCAVLFVVLFAHSTSAAELIVEVEGLDSSQGQAIVAVCRTSFEPTGCPFGAQRPAEPNIMTFRFDGIDEGRYAVAVFHDIDDNGRMNTIFPGIPLEPYGFSNGIGRRAPPRFEQALVAVGPESSTVQVTVQRLFR